MKIRELKWNGIYWINMAQGEDHWGAMNLRKAQNEENFLNS